MDRRTSLRWILAAGAAGALAPPAGLGGQSEPSEPPAAVRVQGGGSVNYGAMTRPGYGTDPDLVKDYHRGEIWPLTLTAAQRRLAAMLSDLIIPADARSPSASAAGVVDFLDEWLSAPYPDCQRDRRVVLEGFTWLDAQAQHRFGRDFAALEPQQQTMLCDRICRISGTAGDPAMAEGFFARYRDLTAGGFYSSPFGRSDLAYLGNVPRNEFPPPPAALLQKLGLPEELPSVGGSS